MNDIYINSSPATTWNDIQETYDINDGKFWMKYFIPEQIYENICKTYLKRLSISERTKLDFFLYKYAPKIVEEK